MAQENRMDDLDDLFARARTVTAADLDAGERALGRWRAGRARLRARAWTSGLLATAAMLGALILARPTAELPTSAAYDAYHSATGEGW